MFSPSDALWLKVEAGRGAKLTDDHFILETIMQNRYGYAVFKELRLSGVTTLFCSYCGHM